MILCFTFAYVSKLKMSSRTDLRIIILHEFKLGHREADQTLNIYTPWNEGSAAKSTMRRWFAKFSWSLR